MSDFGSSSENRAKPSSETRTTQAPFAAGPGSGLITGDGGLLL